MSLKLIKVIILLVSIFYFVAVETNYDNVRVLNNTNAQNVNVPNGAFISGNITVLGTVNNTQPLSVVGDVTQDSVALFADDTGKVLKGSNVKIDNQSNITINGITKGTGTVGWPSAAGLAGEALTSDGAGNLVYTTPSGSGNVSTASLFSSNNRLLVTDTDTITSSSFIKQSGVTLAGNDITGVDNLTTNTIYGNLTGNATSATEAWNFAATLAGDVTGGQHSTVVEFVGGLDSPAQEVVTLVDNVSTATSEDVALTIVKRDSSKNFKAGVITANSLLGDVTGTLYGVATSAINTVTTTYFTGPFGNDLSGTQLATVVARVGGQLASSIATMVDMASTATSENVIDTLVKRDASGSFKANIITADLIGSVTGNISGQATTAITANSAVDFLGSLTGDVIGKYNTTVVKTVGGQSAANVANAAVLAHNATSLNNIGQTQIVRRDGSKDFIASTITADLVGSVTGHLYGNAASATHATNVLAADYTTDFLGALTGDVTGLQGATVVKTVGGKTAAQVSSFVDTVNLATPNDTGDTIVRRDSLGNFTTSMITLTGTITDPTDATTKEYVDAQVSSAIVPKNSVIVVSTISTNTFGFDYIDSVTVADGNRVLLVAQSAPSSPIYNGIWEARSGDWNRPSDFASGTQAQGAYVLTTSGLINAGSSWMCNTPYAYIGTDTITFVEFSIPGKTTAANIGAGDGKVFRDKIGTVINLKTLIAGQHMVIANNTDEIQLSTDATSANIPDTIILRDFSSSFSASLAGYATDNVLKSGDIMTGNLDLVPNLGIRSALDLQDSSGTKFVDLRAPNSVSASYTLDLPASVPTAGQYLQALSSSATIWASISAPPLLGKVYYVSKAGNDSNDGSISAPFASVKHAVSQANLVANSTNPVSIIVGAGIFSEHNAIVDGGPIAITGDYISIVGSSEESTIIKPLDVTSDLFTTTASNLDFSHLCFQADAGSTAKAISLNSNSYGRIQFDSISTNSFSTGMNLNSASGAYPIIFIQNSQFAQNGTSIAINNLSVYIKSSYFSGQLAAPATNTAITVTGAGGSLELFDTNFFLQNIGVSVSSLASLNVLNSSFEYCTNSIVCTSSSKTNIGGTSFLSNTADAVNIAVSNLGTTVYVESSIIKCLNLGMAINVTDDAVIYVSNSTIDSASIGVQTGVALDTKVNTSFISNSLNLMYCTLSLNQFGSSKIKFIGGAIDPLNVNFEKPENAELAAFSTVNQTCLAFGNKTNIDKSICDIQNGVGISPSYEYKANFYANRGVLFQDLNPNPVFNGNYTEHDNTDYFVVVKDTTKDATCYLISDTSVVPGQGGNVRGWAISKLGNFGLMNADLAFTYTNSDLDGQQAAIGPNTVMSLNGFDNIVQFPTATNPPYTTPKLIWAGDTNLYRDSAGVLKTDGGLIVSGLTANMVVTADASKKLVSSSISETQLEYLSSVTADIQTQIDSKVSIAGDTMTGTLILPAGSASSPSLLFAGSTNTGLSAQSTGTLVFSTAGIERMRITGDGTIYMSNYTAVPGVMHNASSGLLTSTTIINVDIASNANIADSKLATISSIGKVQNSATTATGVNIASAIVARDALGTFTATTIFANLLGHASSAGSFTGQLYGDVIGTQTATVVSTVGGKTAAQISSFVDLVGSATSSGLAGFIVARDALGSFTVNMISLLGTTSNYSDMATKGYTDGAINVSYVGNVLAPGVNTITQDGLYTLTSNLNASIIINSDNVTIDLRDYTLTLSSAAIGNIIYVSSGRTNIEIKNGKIEDAYGLTQYGVRVDTGCQLINLSNLKIYSCGTGIFYSGTSGSKIVRGRVQNCIFNSCSRGILLNYAEKIAFQNCQSFSCIYSGFEQNYSNYNIFENCQAFETINNDPVYDAKGFSSFSGIGNLFNECLAEGTTKSAGNYVDYSARAIGFLLTGTQNSMENDSKIINSIANTTFVSTVSCMAYGMLLDPVLKSGTFPSLFIASTPTYSFIQINKWSPDGNYLAVGGVLFSAKVFKFTGSSLVLVATAPTVGAAPVCIDLDWSPDGKYLAVGGYNGSNRIYVFKFDGSTLTSVVTPIDHGDVISGISWSPDGKYLAISGVVGTGSKIEVYEFDPAGSVIRLIAGLSPAGTEYKNITWSPCGKYLSSALWSNGGGFDPIQVFQFTGSAIIRIAGSNYYPSDDSAMTKWSPSGKYLALVGAAPAAGGASKVVVFKFDPTATVSLEPFSEYTHYISAGSYTFSVNWSPNEKYLVIGGVVAGASGSTNLRVLPFTYGIMTPVAEKNYCFGGGTTQVRSVSISPTGKYLAVTGDVGYASVFNFMDAPYNCLLQENVVCNATSYLSSGTGYSRQAIGICGSGDNLYLKNVGFASDVNFNKAIYNNYGTSLISSNAKKFDNLWQPPYENAYGYSYQ